MSQCHSQSNIQCVPNPIQSFLTNWKKRETQHNIVDIFTFLTRLCASSISGQLLELL
jgi:hypothetical protein